MSSQRGWVKWVAVLSALGVLVLSASIALAAPAAKFHSTSSSVNNAGALVVSWDERGVGSGGGPIDYLLTATASATYHCQNNGGNFPSAANKTTVEADVSATGSFSATQGGRVVASLTAGPPAPTGGFSCPGGQTLVLTEVSYTNIQLTDLTNDSSTSVANASRTLIVVP